jgi:hypothetical protein
MIRFLACRFQTTGGKGAVQASGLGAEELDVAVKISYVKSTAVGPQ